MDHSSRKVRIPNAEFMLLQLISEQREISGYEINKLVQERGYREWADIGTTSIYIGLDRLREKGLVEYRLATDKKGKGPLPKKFRVTSAGANILKTETLNGLEFPRERSRRFDLALASLPVLKLQEAIGALRQRKGHLSAAHDRIIKKFELDGGETLPLHVKALFEHSLLFITTEQTFIDHLINKLKKEGQTHEKSRF